MRGWSTATRWGACCWGSPICRRDAAQPRLEAPTGFPWAGAAGPSSLQILPPGGLLLFPHRCALRSSCPQTCSHLSEPCCHPIEVERINFLSISRCPVKSQPPLSYIPSVLHTGCNGAFCLKSWGRNIKVHLFLKKREFCLHIHSFSSAILAHLMLLSDSLKCLHAFETLAVRIIKTFHSTFLQLG